MAKPKRRRIRKRNPVSRTERVEATPETIAKLRPCVLKAMVEAGTMEHDQYEAALQIWDANDALVKGLKAGTVDMDKIAHSHGGTSDGKARLIAIYLQWASELPIRCHLTSGIVLGWIDDDSPYTRMVSNVQRQFLTRACDHWLRVKDQHDRAYRVERNNSHHILTAA